MLDPTSSMDDCLWIKDDPRDFHELANDAMLDLQEFEEEKRRTELIWLIISLPAFPARRLCKFRILSEDDGFALVGTTESLNWSDGNCVIEGMLLGLVTIKVLVSSAWDASGLIGDIREGGFVLSSGNGIGLWPFKDCASLVPVVRRASGHTQQLVSVEGSE